MRLCQWAQYRARALWYLRPQVLHVLPAPDPRLTAAGVRPRATSTTTDTINRQPRPGIRQNAQNFRPQVLALRVAALDVHLQRPRHAALDRLRRDLGAADSDARHQRLRERVDDQVPLSVVDVELLAQPARDRPEL